MDLLSRQFGSRLNSLQSNEGKTNGRNHTTRGRRRQMGAVKSLDEHRALCEARLILKASIKPGQPIWRRHIRYGWQTGFRRAVVVELLPNLDLRVKDARTGEVLVQGAAAPAGR